MPSVVDCINATASAQSLSFTRKTVLSTFASKNLVTAQMRLRLYSEQQRAFGIGNICYSNVFLPVHA